MRLAPSLAALALLLVASPALAEQWDRSFPAPTRPHVVVDTDDGQVEVVTWDRHEVAVRVETHTWHIGSQVRPEATQSGSDIRISARTPHQWFSLNLNDRGLRITVSVPKQTDLEVTSADGSVSVGDVTGRVDVETTDGAIALRGARGDLRLRSTDGGIDGEWLDGRLNASTQDGRIRVSGRFDALDLGSGDGRVTAEAAEGSALGAGWSVHTQDGAVMLRIPQTLKADIEARTGDGRITLEVPLEFSGDWNHRHLAGKLNGGGGPLRIHTGDGSIRLARL